MKKFRSFKQSIPKEEKKDRRGLYLSMFLAGIMIFSVFGIFMYNDQGESYTYGKYSFKQSGSYWSSKINSKNVVFYYLPEQIVELPVSEGATQQLKNSYGFAISFNPNYNETSKLQVMDIFRFEVLNAVVDKYKDKQVIFAVTEQSKYDLPVISCVNSSRMVPVVILDYGNETSIKQENNCIKVSASDEYGMLMLTDYVKYSIYGVFDEKTK